MAQPALERVYRIIHFDALQVKVREDRSCAPAPAIWRSTSPSTAPPSPRDLVAGHRGRQVLAGVLNDLHRRGVGDVLIACVDGLTGSRTRCRGVPTAWVQTCIVHLIRSSLRSVNYRDRRRLAASLRPVYTAANAEAALDDRRSRKRGL